MRGASFTRVTPISTLELGTVSDDELIRRLGELVAHSHRVEADLVAHIGELDERQLYARRASPSTFAYCTEALHLSEAEAYRRITVARAARKHPVLLAMLRDGRVHLSGLALLVPLLTRENCEALLERATHRTKRQIEVLVAELAPRPDAPSTIRRLPEPRLAPMGAAPLHGPADAPAGELVPGRVDAEALVAPAASPDADLGNSASAASLSVDGSPNTASPRLSTRARPSPATIQPLSPGRYKIQFTASTALRDKIERLRALMRSEEPDGDLAVILEHAVTEKLERLEARRFAKTAAPRKSLPALHPAPTTRQIPAAVRRAVVTREGGRCAFVDPQGRRCPERDRLEFHHRRPFGMGGDHSLGNVGLLCAAHNRRLAELDDGRPTITARLEKESPAQDRARAFGRIEPDSARARVRSLASLTVVSHHKTWLRASQDGARARPQNERLLASVESDGGFPVPAHAMTQA